MKIGKAKYDKGNRNYFSFKKDQNVFTLRILPPMGELADAGKWFVYYKVEYGHKGSDGKMKPFLCTRKVNKDKMVEQESECHLKRVAIEEQLKLAESNGDSATVERCKKLLGTFNLDKKYYVNAIDLQGNIGLFKIGYRGFKALEDKIEKLRNAGIDPLSVNDGRFFTFSRSGRGMDTIYTVEEYKQKKTIKSESGEEIVVDAPFKHVLTDSIIAKLENDAFELNKIYPEVTPQEEYRIVHEGPVAVDQILGKSNKTQQATATTTQQAAPAQESVQQPVDQAQAMGAPANAPVESPQKQADVPQSSAAETTTVQSGNTETTVNTSTGEVVSEQQTQEKQSTPSASGNVADMSDEDFYNQIKNGMLG